ncbi:MAG: GNAT family N-acetyltransferase [Clostridia bacterium]|nr:GNAT family N-acetyltransferase [Clostridia bacterium]
MKQYIISETEEYEKLVPFFIENELEFTDEDAEEVPTDLVKCWQIADLDGDLVGAFVLAQREGEYICDGIAIDESLRGTGLGSRLLELGLAETVKLGGERMYLVARAPEFFRRNGFVTVPRQDAPNFFECLTCPQYGVSCHPEVMKIDL